MTSDAEFIDECRAKLVAATLLGESYVDMNATSRARLYGIFGDDTFASPSVTTINVNYLRTQLHMYDRQRAT